MAGRRKAIKTDIAEKLSAIGNIRKNEPLSKHTSLGIGGNAAVFAEAENKQQLAAILKITKEENIKIFVIGGGTNILFSDENFDGIIIKLCGSFRNFEFKETSLYCGSGTNLSYIAKQTIEKNLSGLEYFTAIPGTVGGAVYGNAGIKGRDISSVIKSVEIMDYDGKITVLKAENISFAYRKSGLKNIIITGVNFALKKADKNDMLNEVSEELAKRRITQPTGTKNAGCIFKNPQYDSAGKLIDSLGLKGHSIGDIEVSAVHANFFVNKGNGTAKDMTALIEFVKEKVKEKFNINLETEIKIIK